MSFWIRKDVLARTLAKRLDLETKDPEPLVIPSVVSLTHDVAHLLRTPQGQHFEELAQTTARTYTFTPDQGEIWHLKGVAVYSGAAKDYDINVYDGVNYYEVDKGSTGTASGLNALNYTLPYGWVVVVVVGAGASSTIRAGVLYDLEEVV